MVKRNSKISGKFAAFENSESAVPAAFASTALKDTMKLGTRKFAPKEKFIKPDIDISGQITGKDSGLDGFGDVIQKVKRENGSIPSGAMNKFRLTKQISLRLSEKDAKDLQDDLDEEVKKAEEEDAKADSGMKTGGKSLAEIRAAAHKKKMTEQAKARGAQEKISLAELRKKKLEEQKGGVPRKAKSVMTYGSGKRPDFANSKLKSPLRDARARPDKNAAPRRNKSADIFGLIDDALESGPTEEALKAAELRKAAKDAPILPHKAKPEPEKKEEDEKASVDDDQTNEESVALKVEEARIAEQKKQAEEKLAEEARLEAENEARIAKEKAAEEARIAKEKAAEEARIAEEKKAAEEARIAEEKKAAEETRIAEEKKAAEEARIEEEKAVEKEKAAEEARIAEEIAAEEARAAEEACAAKEKAAEEARLKAAQEKAAEDARVKAAEEARIAEERRVAKEKAEEEKPNNIAGSTPNKITNLSSSDDDSDDSDSSDDTPRMSSRTPFAPNRANTGGEDSDSDSSDSSDDDGPPKKSFAMPMPFFEKKVVVQTTQASDDDDELTKDSSPYTFELSLPPSAGPHHLLLRESRIFNYGRDKRSADELREALKEVTDAVYQSEEAAKQEMEAMKKEIATQKEKYRREMDRKIFEQRKENEKQAKKDQKAFDSEKKIIQDLRDENARWRGMRDKYPKQIAEVNASTKSLEDANKEVDGHFESLNKFVKKLEADHEKLDASVKVCRDEYLPRYRQELYERNQFADCETKIKNLYRDVCYKISKAVEKSRGGASFHSDVKEIIMETEAEVNPKFDPKVLFNSDSDSSDSSDSDSDSDSSSSDSSDSSDSDSD